jgi:hypothetical protein
VNHTVTRTSEIKTGKQFAPYGKPTKRKLATLELAQKCFRYWLWVRGHAVVRRHGIHGVGDRRRVEAPPRVQAVPERRQ